ncbi:LysM peptidoglycan-binding domain-containing protein [Hymenobacter sp. 5317J-9]|uniref:DPBB and LysM peptidoglycan-binding domain-containing protein n=1 Tax=Hymenobacter sp. 5317J-9 TaxID=2932250 RepID=UPI001FD70B95|nr:LysM peptidoglycan-binding domain-containing protein [Hymenobacter sp. 5317J-9]UOQ96592.1 LysM peptidoglycan-binding domain-containing protein [Hymenobacter sp. 5317J-9]
MTILLSLFTVLALGGPGPGKGAAKGTPSDSIGVEMRGGQRFVKHRVTAGETLTALTRRYHVTLEQLTAANPQIKNGLGIGQIVFVPRPPAGKAAAASSAAKTPPASGVLPAKHTVAKGETLFAIARKYQVTPDELIRLNKLPGNGAVRVGQQLQIAGAAEAAAPTPAPAAPAATTPVRPVEVEAVPATTVAKTPPPAPDKPAQIATVTPTAPAEKEKEKEEERTPTRAGELLSRVVESGLGAPIEKSVTDKYLALHKTAPVGTIMQVRNSMNGLSVYVRVIGKLPDTGENNNILVRLSPRAVQKLGTTDSRFRVETNYIPQ